MRNPVAVIRALRGVARLVLALAVWPPPAAGQTPDPLGLAATVLSTPPPDLTTQVEGTVTYDASAGALGPWGTLGMRWSGPDGAVPTAALGLRYRARNLRVTLGVRSDVAYLGLGRLTDGGFGPAQQDSARQGLLRPTEDGFVPITEEAQRGVTQERVTDLAGSVEWIRPAIELRLTSGVRLGGGAEQRTWAAARAAVPLVPRLALIAGIDGGRRFNLARGETAVALGFEVRTSLRRRAAPPRTREEPPRTPARPAEAPPSRFIAEATAGRVSLRLFAPAAHQVHLRGDLTGWTPVALSRDGDGWWTVSLPADPGVHRVSVRVDGGAWTVPPGLARAADGFADDVGILIVD
jgi:Carbohydrate-binding module 48 (Isoamylase N-terminal domain)